MSSTVAPERRLGDRPLETGLPIEAEGAAAGAEIKILPYPHEQSGWGKGFDPQRLASLELRMWKAYYRRRGARLFGLLVLALREQAHVSFVRALGAALLFTRAALGFARATGDYDRFEPDVARGYRLLRLAPSIDVAEVAHWEVRWWAVRREIGVSAGDEAGRVIARLYAALYAVPEESVAEAGRLRGIAAEVRDRGALADPEGPRAPGKAYWPKVARLLQDSYRELDEALARS